MSLLGVTVLLRNQTVGAGEGGQERPGPAPQKHGRPSSLHPSGFPWSLPAPAPGSGFVQTDPLFPFKWGRKFPFKTRPKPEGGAGPREACGGSAAACACPSLRRRCWKNYPLSVRLCAHACVCTQVCRKTLVYKHFLPHVA